MLHRHADVGSSGSAYRYYAAAPAKSAGAPRCPAIDTLLNLYGDLNLFEDSENERPPLEDELASTEAQLRDTAASIDRYLGALEARR